jgi:hypothetical protein
MMTDGSKLQEREVVVTRRDGTPTREHGRAASPESLSPAARGSAPGYGFGLEWNQLGFARWFHGITTLSDEVTQFIQRRLQDEMAGWSALASCRTPEEAFECQRRFAEKATAQYAEEVARLSQMMMRLATEGLGLFRHLPPTKARRAMSSSTFRMS